MQQQKQDQFIPSEVFHENSKLHDYNINFYSWLNFINTDENVKRVITKPILTYRPEESILLKKKFKVKKDGLADTLVKRRTRRKFNGDPIRLNELARILYFSNGVTGTYKETENMEWYQRTFPTSGGLQPVETYLAPVNVEGLDKSIYYYNPVSHALEKTHLPFSTSELVDAMPAMEKQVESACFALFLCPSLQRIQFKYGERGYRFALLESGHIAQNFLLMAESEKLGAVPVGGYIDDKLNNMLGLDGMNDLVIYVLLFGRIK